VYEAIQSGRPIPIEPLISLHGAGLIHILPERQPTSVRFYVAFTPLPGTSFRRVRGLDLVVRTLDELGMGPTVSVYAGIGFATHLLSFVAPSFEHVRDRLKRITPLARLLNMRTMTLLCADNDATESDTLNPQTEISPELSALANILGGEYETRLLHLKLDEQHEIGEVFRQCSHLLSTPFANLFLALLQARIDGDLDRLNRELVVVLHFESLLKVYLQELYEAYLGEDWEQKIQQTAQSIPKIKHEVSREFRFSFLSLGALAQTTNKLVSEGYLPGDDVESLLGSTWVVDLEKFASAIRNPLAHGATFGVAFARTFLEKWRERAELLCRIGEAYDRLRSRAQKAEDNTI
jgi:hypothetical protein